MRTTRLSFLLALGIASALELVLSGIVCSETTPTPAPSGSPSFSPPSLPTPTGLAPLEVRTANAKSVKVQTSILGLELGSTLKEAHAKLDKLRDPAQPEKEEKKDSESDEESEKRVLWQLAKTEYAAIEIKADDNERITHISAFLRPGKEIPFDKIGEVKKAPAQSANVIAWDVLRPNRPLFRVVASGSNRKANTLFIFIVNRPASIKSSPGNR